MVKRTVVGIVLVPFCLALIIGVILVAISMLGIDRIVDFAYPPEAEWSI